MLSLQVNNEGLSEFGGKRKFKDIDETMDKIVAEKQPVAKKSYGARTRVAALFQEGCEEEFLDKVVNVCGWARTIRAGGKGAFAFVELNDGSNFKSL
jgi:hypothetical protein